MMPLTVTAFQRKRVLEKSVDFSKTQI